MDLGYDEYNRLSSYHIAYPASQEDRCHVKDSYSGYGIVKTAVEGQLSRDIFPDIDDTDDNAPCAAACLIRGSDAAYAAFPMPHRRWTAKDPSNEDEFANWETEYCKKVEVCFMNYHDPLHPLEIFWVKPVTGEQIKVNTIPYGERNTKCFSSFLGHQFSVKAVQGNTDPDATADDTNTDTNNDSLTEIANVTVEFDLILGFGHSPPHGENFIPGQFDKQINSTLRAEWIRHNKPKHTFSPLGFSKGRLPDDVFGSIGAFYHNNKYHKTREEWQGKGVFVNWWEADVFMIQIPWSIKTVWAGRLADLVSEWCGTPVTQTVMYGLRQYESGARLLTHVDRLTTHVVSLIVNVAQGNLSEDWPVEVFDHAGRLHEVTMTPGDIVYYESAKNLHSRNRPLMGDGAHYVNLFTHYRPSSMDENWYLLPTPEERKPVLEVEGECRVPDKIEGKNTEYLGYGKVKCDDPRLGKNLSPSLFVADSGEDLIEWFRRTSPEGHIFAEEPPAVGNGEDDDDYTDYIADDDGGYDEDEDEDYQFETEEEEEVREEL